MADAYYLSEGDKNAIQRLLDQSRNRPVNQQRAPLPEDHTQNPDVFLALTPQGGIPGVGVSSGVEDVVRSAECRVFRLTDDDDDGMGSYLEIEGLTRRVYNLSGNNIAGCTWVLALRDRFGSWWVGEVGTVTSDARLCSSAGTTTTTTRAPCSGYCTYDWNAAGSVPAWSQSSNTCSAGCECVAPTFSGGEECAVTRTRCTPTTTTRAPSSPCPTTIAPGECGGPCQWMGTGGSVLPIGNASPCAPGCGCSPPALGFCETGSTPCLPEVLPYTPCGGKCWFICNAVLQWQMVSFGCNSNISSCGPCGCDTPSFGCSVCGQMTEVPCTCTDPCAPTSTTTTCAPDGCCGPCTFRANEGLQWVLQGSQNCGGCGCVQPPFNPTVECETYQTGCLTTSTTSSTSTSSTTSTTTTEAPCGNCVWEGGSSGTWNWLSNGCAGGNCFCYAPGSLSTPGQVAQTNCYPTTTTSTTTTTTPCPATTAPPAPTCGVCHYQVPASPQGPVTGYLFLTGCTGGCTCPGQISYCSPVVLTSPVVVTHRCTAATTTSTSTTTTPAPPCGTCTFEWGFGSWNALPGGVNCTGGCACVQPATAGTVEGEQRTTNCAP